MVTVKVKMNKLLAFFGIYTDAFKLGGLARSSRWPETKRKYEALVPKACRVCGSKKVQLHHIQSFHSNPERENDMTNLIWLCEGLLTDGHHQWFGHLGNFQSINENVLEWIDKVEHRPKYNELTATWINK